MKNSESVKHTYEYQVNMGDDSAAAHVLRMVKPEAKVLEIGAGPGSITKHLSSNLGCDVVALEINAEALEQLRQHARKIYDLDLNNPVWSTKIKEDEGAFDFVIAADVLEHVYDPWTVLAGMKSLLNETGSIIVSLPHASHACVLGCLIDEDFCYRDTGLLDRTHIRFFGLKNMQELFERAGLAIDQFEFVIRPPLMTEFAEQWQKIPLHKRLQLQESKFSQIFQVVCRAIPHGQACKNLKLIEAPAEKFSAQGNPQEQASSPGFIKIDSDNATNQAIIKEYHNLQQSYQTLQNDMRNKEDMIRQILSSHSWKLTRPLRITAKLAKNTVSYMAARMKK